MTNNQITFNDLPQVVAELRDEVSGMKALLLNLQNRPTQQRENRHRPVTPEQVAEYTNIPLATIYQKLANREIPGSKPGKRWVIYLDEIDKWLEANRKNPIPLTDEEQNAAILASHKRKPNKSSWQTDPIVEPSKKVNVASATTSPSPKAIADPAIASSNADCVNVVDIPDDSEQSNDGIHSTESDNATSIDGINASDVTSSFDRLKVIYKKVGNNESQAFGVWQQLSESERTAAFAHTQRLQGDLSLRSYLYVYLRDKEWMRQCSYEVEGLPDACHIKQASGSSLPVPIFIGRWTDHINLQAEVTVSGIKLFSHMAGHEYRSRYQRVISSV